MYIMRNTRNTPVINMEEVYIEYMNKDKNFTVDKKSFKSWKDAEKWARKEFDRFNPDMISYYAEGES